MRDKAIVLLAAASSIMFSIAGAREQSDLQPPLENISRESWLAQSPARLGNSIDSRESRGMVSSARMITWSVCSAPSSGSALSIYSIHAKAGRSPPGSAMHEDDRSDLCVDDDE
jgi:hypothetical protein